MNKLLYIIILSFLLVACTSNTIIEKPDNLIPKDKMVDLMTDLLLATGARNIKNINEERKVNYFPLVFEKYNIDSTQFKESNFYYTSKIDDYDIMLKEVERRLKKLKSEFDKEREKQDSITNYKGILIEDEIKNNRREID
ncbi:DUF4296 domain-containing protein [Lutibacter aestuarii]|uniref:DUF4296 domain-containing protein n=1 Tax=Lutibacter aestuarii TaxID=861111 RepID=A0ABW2Z6B3_9FLAO|nr:DUF4296 domain-containing protein [uncultured Lutibacter sp.]